MFVKKTLTALSVVALVAGAPSMVFAADAASVNKQSQVFKTGQGAAAGQQQQGRQSSSYVSTSSSSLME